MLRMPADIWCGAVSPRFVSQSYVGRIIGCANLPQDYLFAPSDDVNGINRILLKWKAVCAQCRIDIFRSYVPVIVF